MALRSDSVFGAANTTPETLAIPGATVQNGGHLPSHVRALAAMATALFESLLINHPFIDGNKRVAFFATDVFLRLNGWRLDVDAEEAHTFLIGLLERGRCDYEHLEPWIRQSLVRIQ